MIGIPNIGPGTVIAGKYRLEEQLGRGGFGAIFQAQRLSDGLAVAVKLLFSTSHQMSEDEIEQRFQRETLMAQELRHPYTVEQFDFGRSERGIRYIAMELLKGETLIERLERSGPLSTELIIKIARGVLQALHLAHSKDIVHRDLKPENIMLCKVGQDPDFPKVLDFGAAKSIEGEHDITSAGLTLGSPAFMAPELLMGSAATPLCDLYALGLTLAEALIGERIVQGRAAFDRAKVQLSPEPLTVPPRLANHPLYPWLARAFEKKPQNRYANAHEMLSALDKVADTIQTTDDRTGPIRIPADTPGITPENTDVLNTHDPGEDPTEAMQAPSDIALQRAKNMRRSRPQPPLPADDDFAPEKTEFLSSPADDDFADEATSFIPKPDLPKRKAPRTPPPADDDFADDDFADEATSFIPKPDLPKRKPPRTPPPADDDFADEATAFIPKPDLPEKTSPQVTSPADDDFADEATAFIPKPDLPPKNERRQRPSGPQRPQRAENRPPSRPQPPSNASRPSSSSRPPHPNNLPDEEPTERVKRQHQSTPVNASRQSSFGSDFGKSRHRSESAGSATVEVDERLEPSAATDYQILKTSDGMKERRTVLIFAGIFVIFIIFLLTVFWIGPDNWKPEPRENRSSAVIPGQ